MTIPPHTPSREHQVQARGLDFAVTEYTSSSAGTLPLVLLHGIGSRGTSWWPVIDPLAERFSLYVVDLRGHGGSSKPPAGYALPDYAADLTVLLPALGLERPAILGHSLGGLIALHWAISHPDVAAGLILEDTSFQGGRDVLPSIDGWLALNALTPQEAAAYYRREYPTWAVEDCHRRAETITGTARGVFVDLRTEAANLDGPGDRISPLKVVRSPVLLIHGDRSTGSMVLPEDAARFSQTVPQSKVVRIPGAGHSIHRDFPDAFLAAVLPFLLSLEDRQRGVSLQHSGAAEDTASEVS